MNAVVFRPQCHVCVTMFPLVIGKENLELDRQGLCSFFLYLH